MKKGETQWGFLIACGFVVFLAGACTKVGSSNSNSKAAATAPSDTVSTSSEGSFQLTSVLPTSGSGSTYDLIGQNQQFDTYCNGSYGVCVCQYSYTEPGVGAQTQNACVLYSEADLLRCANAVPSGIKTFNVRILVENGSTACTTPSGAPSAGTSAAAAYNSNSNSLTVNLDSGVFAGATGYLDLTSAQSYVQANRFQCRKNEWIANPMDANTIDPFQSADPHLIYAFNFYTTNVADSLVQSYNTKDTSWECTLTATKDHSLHWWANPYVYSTQSCSDPFCSGDGQLMAPVDDLVSGPIPVTGKVPSNGKRRSSFSLASKAYGVFQTPVQAAVAPSSYVTSNYAIIGYAAKPVPGVSGTSSCPSIKLPANSTWVKLWNFRGTDITAPVKVVTSSSADPRSGAIACNTDSSSGNGVFPTCSYPGNDKVSAAPAAPFMNNAALDNVTGSKMALRVNWLTGAYGIYSPCYSINTDVSLPVSSHSWTNGQETWSASPLNPMDGSAAQAGTFPWNIYLQISQISGAINPCQRTSTNNGDGIYRFQSGTCPASSSGSSGNIYTAFGMAARTGSAAPSPYPVATPMDPASRLQTASLNAGVNYTDQMFVVTDQNVNDNSMNSSTPSEYLPITYRSSSDCNGATNSGCKTTPIHWMINDHEISSDPYAQSIYPLCVLQFYD